MLYGTPNGAWRSIYSPLPSRPTLIRGATVMTAAGRTLENSDVLLRDGQIADVGQNLETPSGAEVIDATGRFVTPGLIDTHSHMGDYPDPSVAAHSDGNEATSPTTPEVWAAQMRAERAAGSPCDCARCSTTLVSGGTTGEPSIVGMRGR